MEHTEFYSPLLAQLGLPAEYVTAGKTEYPDKGYFVQAYMVILRNFKVTEVNKFRLHKLIKDLDTINSLCLSRPSRIECLRRLIEVCFFGCETRMDIYKLDPEFEDLKAEFYELFKILDY